MERSQVEQLNAKLRKLMESPRGLEVFLSKITSPLRTKRNVISGVRKVFLYDQLGQGDVPVYDMDPEGYAYD